MPTTPLSVTTREPPILLGVRRHRPSSSHHDVLHQEGNSYIVKPLTEGGGDTVANVSSSMKDESGKEEEISSPRPSTVSLEDLKSRLEWIQNKMTRDVGSTTPRYPTTEPRITWSYEKWLA